MTITFDKELFEGKFKEAENYLLDIKNVSLVLYLDFDHESFDANNQELLNTIAQKSMVYCIWTGESNATLEYKYIGHVAKNYSRQRLRNHLTKKHVRTGAQLKNTILALKEKHVVGISYLETEPHYMRKALEDWLIDKYSNSLIWNKAGKVKKRKIDK